jgi:hypothetical protein
VLGQVVFSVLLLLCEASTIEAGPVNATIWGAICTFNMVRGVGAVLCMVQDIEAGGKASSMGVVLVMMALQTSSVFIPPDWTRLQQAFGVIGLVVCFAGVGLYTASGILSIIHTGFPGLYVTVVVTMGCPDGLQYPGLFDNTPVYCPALQPNYEFKAWRGTGFFPGILWIVGFFGVFVVLSSCIPVFYSLCTSPSLLWQNPLPELPPSIHNYKYHAKGRRAFITYAVWITLLGGLFSTISGLTGPLYRATESFIDCRNSQEQSYGYTGCNQTSITLAASPSGYLTTWSKHWESIIRSMFVW